jgi:DNA ligase-1
MTAFRDLVDGSRELATLRGRRQKVERIAALLRGCDDADVAVVARWLTGETGSSVLGIGPAQVAEAIGVEPATTPALTVSTAADALSALATIRGTGSRRLKTEKLSNLFARATAEEQQFLARLLLAELRQGALAGLVLEAIAIAFELPLVSVRRAHMLTGDCGEIAAIARGHGRAGIDAVQLRLFHPIQPMLAQPADGVSEALRMLGQPLLEYKLDGARVQVHKRADEVRVFSRQGNDVTAAVPEIVEQISVLPVSELVLDGETLSIGSDGQPRPFQTTMRRFGRHRNDETLRAQLPLQAFYFDCLRLDGETLIDAETLTRRAALREVVPAPSLMPAIQTAVVDEAQSFLERALAAGHEGLMAKSIDAPYAAGGRGNHWLKVKQVHTLDLAVLAAEWGSGRRQGWLSNLHLGARTDDGFVMLGKTFKGLTDERLAWQTEQLLSRATRREGGLVEVRPELVVEVAFNELQRSRQYPAGLALRFARVRTYRHDKTAADADHLDTVRALFARQLAYQDAGANAS